MLRRMRVVDKDRPCAINESTNVWVSDKGFREQKQGDYSLSMEGRVLST